MSRARTSLGVAVGLIVLALGARVSFAQETQSQVEARLQALRVQVQEDSRAFAQGEREATSLVETLEALAREQATREALAETYRRRIGHLRAQGVAIRARIDTLEADYARQQTDYRARLVHVYKFGRTDRLALVLSARTPAQMLVRARYLQRFADQRTANLERLRDAADALATERTALAATEQHVQESLQETQAEESRLQAVAAQRTRLLADLRGEQSTLQAALTRKRQEVSALERRVVQLVAAARQRREAEAQRRREAAAREADARTAREADAARDPEGSGNATPTAATPPPPRDATPTPPTGAARSALPSEAEFRALSRAFAGNRGKLPWPVQGAVAESFGTTTNPAYGTKTPSLGIVITTASAAPVRAVFGGEVVGVDGVLGFGTLVMIEHGDYQTVYSNFSSVTVRPGDRIQPGQSLGRSGTSAQPKGRALFFAVFKEGKAQNPARWLRTR